MSRQIFRLNYMMMIYTLTTLSYDCTQYLVCTAEHTQSEVQPGPVTG